MPLRLNMGICPTTLLALCNCLIRCSLRARLRTGPPNDATILFLRNHYREISGFPRRHDNFWMDPPFTATASDSPLFDLTVRKVTGYEQAVLSRSFRVKRLIRTLLTSSIGARASQGNCGVRICSWGE